MNGSEPPSSSTAFLRFRPAIAATAAPARSEPVTETPRTQRACPSRGRWNRRRHRNTERSAKVIFDTVKKIAMRAGVKSHVHTLRAAFPVRMDEQYPGRLVAENLQAGGRRYEPGHARPGQTLGVS